MEHNLNTHPFTTPKGIHQCSDCLTIAEWLEKSEAILPTVSGIAESGGVSSQEICRGLFNKPASFLTASSYKTSHTSSSDHISMCSIQLQTSPLFFTIFNPLWIVFSDVTRILVPLHKWAWYLWCIEASDTMFYPGQANHSRRTVLTLKHYDANDNAHSQTMLIVRAVVITSLPPSQIVVWFGPRRSTLSYVDTIYIFAQ